MRILHVNKFHYRRGGAEGYLFDLTELQRARGDEVAAFAMDHPDNEPSPFEAWFPDEVVLDPTPTTWTGRVGAAGRMLWSRSAARGLQAVVRRFRPDVAHLHNIYHQLSPSIIKVLADERVPTVMTVHDYKLVCPTYQLRSHGRLCQACVHQGPLQVAVRRCQGGGVGASALLAAEAVLHRGLRSYDGVGAFIAPSRFLAGVLAEAGVGDDRVHVVPHFVTADPVPRPAPAADAPVVFAGRLSEEKGVDLLIRAVAARPETRLVIAGDGPDVGALAELAATSAPGRVQFVGRLGRLEVLALLRSAAAVAVPSRWHENQPLAVLEAFGVGAPVVVASLGGLPELVENGDTGWVVPPEDVRGLATAIAQVAADPAEAERRGRAAWERARCEHDPDRHLDAVDACYERAGIRRRAPR